MAIDQATSTAGNMSEQFSAWPGPFGAARRAERAAAPVPAIRDTNDVVVGLALGGGAALGAAHVGVLTALEEAGIKIGVVVGTSAGALIGAGYAAGLSVRLLDKIIRSAEWRDFGRLTVPRKLGVLDPASLAGTIERFAGDRDIEALPRRFAAVATDLRTLAPTLLDSGPLPTALLATIAVPGLFPPVRVADALLIDGAFSSNVPTWGARLLGADRVITVRLTPERTMRPMALLRQAMGGFDDETPDILITPDTTKHSRWSASGVPALIEAGREATEAALADIDELLLKPQTRERTHTTPI
ncbi:patatin-like phospholipase family protein [Hoyosella sp. YIM 151337]|uniref:patatin-like phospholipase family protein n=1 Tax=Hoyosella sp. YIM 151337 TaxID=2992742 RepID=UPI0022369960|nr:patatin-like phospholipase family protein [Hoyosella sp. YIM 151337]MCW4355145.1 patatin-like phospholipase family protein [Hoyosella sp. YIM 151337]